MPHVGRQVNLWIEYESLETSFISEPKLETDKKHKTREKSEWYGQLLANSLHSKGVQIIQWQPPLASKQRQQSLTCWANPKLFQSNAILISEFLGIMTNMRKEIDMGFNPQGFNLYLKHVADADSS